MYYVAPNALMVGLLTTYLTCIPNFSFYFLSCRLLMFEAIILQTLSSLALVFALHHYKPTPLYVMDEIDAALGKSCDLIFSNAAVIP